MSADDDLVGVIILRAWSEGAAGSIRIRVTQTLDVTARQQRSDVTATPEEALRMVRAWLDAFEELSDRPDAVTRR